MTEGWQSVLDDQIDLMRWWRSPEGERYGRGFGESVERVQKEVYGTKDATEGSWLHQIPEVEAAKLWLADPIYVDPDMMALVEAAAEAFRPEPLQPSDLITPYGFVVLPKPLFIRDRHEKRVATRAFAWGPIVHYLGEGMPEDLLTRMPRGGLGETGISLSLYSHMDDEDDFTIERALDVALRLRAGSVAKYELNHITSWAYGGNLPTGEVERSQLSWWTPIQAFLRLTMQTIGDRYEAHPPRAARRRAGRELKPQDDRYVTVIRLRRPRSHENGEHHEVDWKHQWIVGGHWRNQYYPSLRLHRQIYISPYVKGPEDRPLLVRRGRAFELVR